MAANDVNTSKITSSLLDNPMVSLLDWPQNKDNLIRYINYALNNNDQKIAVWLINTALVVVHPDLHLHKLLSNFDINLVSEHINTIKLLLDQLIIGIYYVAELKEAGLLLAQKVLLTDLPLNMGLIRKNLPFYSQAIPHIRAHKMDISSPYTNNMQQTFNLMNPSILLHESGYIVCQRAVNYTQQFARDFHSMDTDGKIRTRNFLLWLDHDFKTLQQYEIVDASERTSYPKHILGQEDCRLFLDEDNDIWASCTSIDSTEKFSVGIAFFRLGKYYINAEQVDSKIDTSKKITQLQHGEEKWSCNSVSFDFFRAAPGPEPGRTEKNWLFCPYTVAEKLKLTHLPNHTWVIYSYQPFTLLHIDRRDGTITSIVSKKQAINCQHFRGSAGPILFTYQGQEGILIVIHEYTAIERKRTYYHRFLWLNTNLEIKAVSPLFYFTHLGIEFCLGLSYSHNGDIICGVGLEDRESYLYIIAKTQVHNMLYNITEFLGIE